eukprot:TRINITY_DN4030_c0_g1_i1.p1 TRINITY_DN4030_c0_g1~~TRINITY_DN4030_c0_g1_i1.p1  ORF type:complete len:207 (-),score=73.69 TRINITY_DN4030_c0_g1_i1:86-706(-)
MMLMFVCSVVCLMKRWQATTQGWVSDGFVDHQKASVLGFLYTDYQFGGGVQRVDEVWNATSIYNTTLGNLGITADTHLFYLNGTKSDYFFNTPQNGQTCWKSPSGMVAQNQFSSANTYKGNATVNGVATYHFRSSFPPPLSKLGLDLFVSVASGIPVQMVVPAFGSFFGGSVVNFITFQEVSSLPEYLFVPPAVCLNALSSDRLLL